MILWLRALSKHLWYRVLVYVLTFVVITPLMLTRFLIEDIATALKDWAVGYCRELVVHIPLIIKAERRRWKEEHGICV